MSLKVRHVYPGFLLLCLIGAACSKVAEKNPEPVSSEKPLAPVVAVAAVDRAVVSTEETVTYSLQVDLDASISLTIPDLGSRISGFRIVDFGTEEKPEEKTGNKIGEKTGDKNRKSIRKWFQLRADMAGSYVLPEVILAYQHEGTEKSVKVAEIFVEVKGVGAPAPGEGEPAEELRDIKGLEPTGHVMPGWLVGLLAALLVAVGGLAFYFIRRSKQVKVVRVPPPHETALARLEGLQMPEPISVGAVKRFHFELSEIVRAYVEGRFGLRATDMTSEEIFRHLAQHGSPFASEQPARIFTSILQETDRAKFTDFELSDGIGLTVQAIKQQAMEFVLETKPIEAPITESVV